MHRRIAIVTALLCHIGTAGPISFLLNAANRINPWRCVECERDTDGSIKRSKAMARRFLREIAWDLPVRYVRVDHIIALACGPGNGGLDAIGNMQLQWADEAKDKDRWERDAPACTPGQQAWYLLEHGQLMPNAHSMEAPAPWVMERARRMKESYDERVAQIRGKQ